MGYIEREGNIQLKPVACYQWEKDGVSIGVRFEFVDREGDKVDGSFGWLKRDGTPNGNIDIFTEAMEKGASLLCVVEKGQPKNNGGFFYRVKWPADGAKPKGEALTPAQIREKAAKARATVDAPAEDLPF